MNEQKNLFDTGDTPNTVECQRCGQRCRVSETPGKKAKMLRFAEGPGLCVNCAVHDWLRNTYPVNMLLAQSSPKSLLLPHIQQQFEGIMRVGFADAKPDEIDWQRIVENWELPFPKKIKPSCMNPCDQKELDAIKAGTHPGLGRRKAVCDIAKEGPITSFEQLNELKPGLGDELRRCVKGPNETE